MQTVGLVGQRLVAVVTYPFKDGFLSHTAGPEVYLYGLTGEPLQPGTSFSRYFHSLHCCLTNISGMLRLTRTYLLTLRLGLAALQ